MGFATSARPSSLRTRLAGLLLVGSLPLLATMSLYLYLNPTFSSLEAADLQRQLLIPAGAGLVTYVVFLLVSWLIFRSSIFQPLDLLQRKVRLIQHGLMTVPSRMQTPAEFSCLLEQLHVFNIERLDTESATALKAAATNRGLSKLSGFINRSPMGIVEWSAEFNAVRWNPAASRMLDIDSNAPTSLSLHTWSISTPNANQELVQGLEQLLHQPSESQTTETVQTDKAGRTTVLRWHNSAHFDKASKQASVLSIIEDVTTLHQEARDLRLSATHDAVTQLPNQVLMEQLITNATETRTTERSALTIMLIDLGKLRLIHNSFGFDAGNEVLKQASAKLQSLLRTRDKLGRLSGDELLIMLPDMESEKQIEQTVQRIDLCLQEPITVDQRPHHLQPSMGVASYPTHARSTQELMRKANIALYAAKADATQSYRLFDPGLEQETQHRTTVESELRRALSDKELDLYLQPLINSRGGKLWGAEALIRWHHPKKGLIYPAEFIPYAEESCLTLDISRFVLERAHRIAADWKRSGQEHLHLSVNLSARQFADPKLTDQLMDLQHTYPIDPVQLIIEITETTLLGASNESLESVKLLKALGYQIALDDFGIGYASMNQFTQFPLDIVKIHRSYIAEAVINPSARAMVTSIIEMARRLGVKAVAEGVESEAAQKLLVEESCDVLQGYLYGKAVPAAEFKARHLKNTGGRKSAVG